MNLTPVPSLDELAADPAKTRELPLHVVEELQVKCVTIMSMLMARQLVARATQATPTELPDTLLDANAAATRLGVSQDWVYRHAPKLPFTVRVGHRSVRFSSKGIDLYIRQQQRKGSS